MIKENIMELRIFNYDKDNEYIESFLTSASLAHKLPKKSKEWFEWKFKDNPFGQTILACAFDKNKIVGCVAYGLQNFNIKGKVIKGALSFETFVHPEYQGKGLFSNLLSVAEKKAIENNVALLLNFPNANSLKGFQNNAWERIFVVEYWTKGKHPLVIPLHIKDIKHSFEPSPSNLDQLVKPVSFSYYPSGNLESEITYDYLMWRFFTYPIAEYHYFESSEYDAIVRIGKRGKIKEAQVLFVNIKQSDNFGLKSLLKNLEHEIDYDLISFPISRNNRLRVELVKNGFIKVPNSTNVCYKIIGETFLTKAMVEKISLSAINFHTY